MPTFESNLAEAFEALGPKPPDEGTSQADKKRYSERLSHELALVFAKELRRRGMNGAQPFDDPGDSGSGVERRMEGGIGAKKVDVTWATEEGGLLIGMSVKTINWKDGRTGNFQKNLTNRRSDLLFEAVTLHRRFPYSVLIGVFCLDAGAKTDDTERRKSTFLNAHDRMRLFTGRDDPAAREEQYERLYIAVHDSSTTPPGITPFEAGEPEVPLTWADVFATTVRLVAERNPDTYEEVDGRLRRRGR